VEVEELRADARVWLADQAETAPPDYGAICPPELIEAGRSWQRRLAEAGWAGIHWPAEHGGRGLSRAHQAVWIEECARAGVPPVLNMVGLVLAADSILRFGDPAQQERHLRRTLWGEQVWCQLFSEPGAGSDLASLTTAAELDGHRFVVDGQKVWCSGGRVSDWGILLARTDPGAPKHQGISFFLIDMASPGIEVRPLRQMTGSSEFDEVFLTGVELPLDALLGPLHRGWGVAMAVLTGERGHIGASVIGLRRRLEALAVVGSADESAAVDPVTRNRLAAVLSRGQAAVALGRRQGAEASVAGSLMKLGIAELLYDSAMLRGDVAGAGALVDGPAAAGMLAAPGGRIAGGTSPVQRTIIGERILGLPRVPPPRS
jgi:alkylation response protein AidB-like acyl-CoA dehydrogenase